LFAGDSGIHRGFKIIAGRLGFHLGPLTLCSLFVLMTRVRSPATRCRRMSNVTYYVAMGFERDEQGDLVAMDPLNISRPLRLFHALDRLLRRRRVPSHSRGRVIRCSAISKRPLFSSARARCLMKFRRADAVSHPAIRREVRPRRA
jgi:hypothetical protein